MTPEYMLSKFEQIFRWAEGEFKGPGEHQGDPEYAFIMLTALQNAFDFQVKIRSLAIDEMYAAMSDEAVAAQTPEGPSA